MNIADLDYYTLFVFKDLTNDRITSTTDIDVLKMFTKSEEFTIGKEITLLDAPYTIKNISLSKVGSSVNSDHKFGWSKEGIEPQGNVKDIFFRVTISLEESLA